MIKMIVATDDNYAIGNNGKLPWPSIKEDMRYFKEMTEDSVVVMGHSTFKSLPFKMGLPNRYNLVLSRRGKEIESTVYGYNNLDFVSEDYVKPLLVHANPSKDIWLIGGSETYKTFLPFVDEIHWTKVSGSFEADTYFDMSFLLSSDDWGIYTVYTLKKDVAVVSVWKRLK